MGFCSWQWADTKGRLMVGGYAYLALPDGTYYYGRYNGYGNIGGIDVYEAVVDWNRDYLVRNAEALLSGELKHECQIEHFSLAKSALDEIAKYGLEADKYLQILVGSERSYFVSKDWKRDLGIYLACEDEDNASLDFPIKICKTNTEEPSKLPASKRDPLQGCD